jgi:hypothetical protein
MTAATTAFDFPHRARCNAHTFSAHYREDIAFPACPRMDTFRLTADGFPLGTCKSVRSFLSCKRYAGKILKALRAPRPPGKTFKCSFGNITN